MIVRFLKKFVYLVDAARRIARLRRSDDDQDQELGQISGQKVNDEMTV
jgi:hypothetical protein